MLWAACVALRGAACNTLPHPPADLLACRRKVGEELEELVEGEEEWRLPEGVEPFLAGAPLYTDNTTAGLTLLCFRDWKRGSQETGIDELLLLGFIGPAVVLQETIRG